MNIGSLLLFGLAAMLVAAIVPFTLLIMAFAIDGGKASRGRLWSTSLLVGVPILAVISLCLWTGWKLL